MLLFQNLNSKTCSKIRGSSKDYTVFEKQIYCRQYYIDLIFLILTFCYFSILMLFSYIFCNKIENMLGYIFCAPNKIIHLIKLVTISLVFFLS